MTEETMEPCPFCDEGWTERMTSLSVEGDQTWKDEMCEVCKGTGEVTEVVYLRHELEKMTKRCKHSRERAQDYVEQLVVAKKCIILAKENSMNDAIKEAKDLTQDNKQLESMLKIANKNSSEYLRHCYVQNDKVMRLRYALECIGSVDVVHPDWTNYNHKEVQRIVIKTLFGKPEEVIEDDYSI